LQATHTAAASGPARFDARAVGVEDGPKFRDPRAEAAPDEGGRPAGNQNDRAGDVPPGQRQPLESPVIPRGEPRGERQPDPGRPATVERDPGAAPDDDTPGVEGRSTVRTRGEPDFRAAVRNRASDRAESVGPEKVRAAPVGRAVRPIDGGAVDCPDPKGIDVGAHQ
jgi:hypothetical protein